MEVTRVPLAERIGMAQEGRTAQPEYLPSLIWQWGKTSIRAYFGGCEKELERFCELMRFTPEDNPPYAAASRRGKPQKGGTNMETLEFIVNCNDIQRQPTDIPTEYATEVLQPPVEP